MKTGETKTATPGTVTIRVGKYGDEVEFFLEYDRDGEKIFWARDPFCIVRHLHRTYRSREEAIVPSNAGVVEGCPMYRMLHPTQSLARFGCRCGFKFVISVEQWEKENLLRYFSNSTSLEE